MPIADWKTCAAKRLQLSDCATALPMEAYAKRGFDHVQSWLDEQLLAAVLNGNISDQTQDLMEIAGVGICAKNLGNGSR